MPEANRPGAAPNRRASQRLISIAAQPKPTPPAI